MILFPAKMPQNRSLTLFPKLSSREIKGRRETRELINQTNSNNKIRVTKQQYSQTIHKKQNGVWILVLKQCTAAIWKGRHLMSTEKIGWDRCFKFLPCWPCSFRTKLQHQLTVSSVLASLRLYWYILKA